MPSVNLARRHFLRMCSLVAAWAAGSAQPVPAAPPQRKAPAAKRRKPYIAIQVPPYAFVDEGTDKVLDILQEKAHINTIWAYTYTYGHYRLRRNEGIPLPDHGVYEFEKDYNGGAFFDYDPKYFAHTILKDFRSPDYKGINIINEVLPKAKARGMDFVAWDYNNANNTIPARMPNYTKVVEIDVHGRRTDAACFNNPDYRNFLFGKIESYLRQYPGIDALAWGCERQGPLLNMIGGGWTVSSITCFCPDCRAKGRDRGIAVDRALSGYLELEKLFEAARHDQRPLDGYFVAFWRLLLQYPEILAWEKLWTDTYHEIRSQIYGIAKAIAPSKPIGWHIMHNMALSPFYRAEEDYEETRYYADFLKPAVYNNSGSPRMAEALDQLHGTILHDAKPQDFLPLYYKIMNFGNEPPYDQLSTAGLSADYVYRETKRAIAGVHGEVAIYPGIDIDIPTKPNEKHTTPDDVRKSVKAAFDAGAEGVVLSRRYSEMKLANLAGAGQGLKDAGVL
jgi:hypothetical protein